MATEARTRDSRLERAFPLPVPPQLLALCAALVGATPAHARGPIEWRKFVSADGRFSLHHPAGWSASESNGMVTLGHPATREEMLVLGLKFDASKNPEELARPVFTLLRTRLPDLRVTDTRGDATTAYFEVTYTTEGSKHSGSALVAKVDGQAVWVSYSAPSQGFDKAYGAKLLAGVLTSVSPGAASRPPAAISGYEPVPPERSRGNASGASNQRPESEAVEPPRRESLLGDWGTSVVHGSVVKAGSGEYLRTSSFGESYGFRADGTFSSLTIASGKMVSGAVIKRGDFKTNGNKLLLHVTASAWTPSLSHPGQGAAWDWKPQDSTETMTWRIVRRENGDEQLNLTRTAGTIGLPRVK